MASNMRYRTELFSLSVISRDKLSGDIALDIVNVNETEAIHLLLPLMHYNILMSVHNHYSPLSTKAR